MLLVLWYWLLNQLKAYQFLLLMRKLQSLLILLQKLLMISKPRAKCKYCPQTYACHSKANGTSSMWTHMLYQCRKSPAYIPAKKYRHIAFDSAENGGHVLSITFDQDTYRFTCARMIIRDELPFSHVEGQGFVDFMRVPQPKFKSFLVGQLLEMS
ncbi:hypothetical protein M0R45_008409 [Rubus argutus]|uniref:BED-type domain-containing protein n=1 Tax=Rubus argutus TaxID=59490 RepID=A0AAW1Y2M7_RUBAR